MKCKRLHKKEEKINIDFIAKESGVSTATVSRVLNRKGYVAPDTKEKVIEVVKKYGFVPNKIAKSLAQKSSFTVGITISHSSGPVFADTFFHGIISGMDEPLYKEGYNLLFLSLNPSEIQYNRYYFINLFKSRQIDGLILLHIPKNNPAFIALEEETAFPYVSIGRISYNQKGSYVDTDNIKRTYMAVEHFIKEHGFKRIGYIGLKPEYYFYEESLKGYKLCHKDHNLEIDKDIIYLTNTSNIEEGYKGIKKILKASPECIITLGNFLLNGVMEYCSENKINIPEDIPLIHCSELSWGSIFELKITQVKQPIFELGRYAVEILLRQIKGNQKREQVVLNPEFRLGNSCGCSLIEGKR